MELARRYSDAVKTGDFDAAAALLDPGVLVVPPSGRSYGLKELRAAWHGPGFDHLVVELEQRRFERDGDEAVMHAQQVYRWKEDGAVAYARPHTTRYTVDGDRIVRIEMTIGERDD